MLTGETTALSSSILPETIQATVRGRIDRLPPEQQLTLKVASVLGRVFRITALEHIHPLHPDAASLRDQLELATELELTRRSDGEDSYTFQHAITQEVAYSMLSFAQRRQLHRAVAEWLESRAGADLTEIYPILAHHWSETEDTLKALDCLEKAGEAAIAGFANTEAVSFFRRALALVETKENNLEGVDLTFRRAHWHRRIGEALFLTGHSRECLSESSRCLELLEVPLPGSKSRLLRMLAGQIGAQTIHLTLPSLFVERDPEDRARFAEAAEAASQCAWTMYSRRDVLALLVASLSSVTWAQKAGRESVMSLGVAGATLAGCGFKKLGDRCFSIGRASAMKSKQYQQLAWLASMETQNLMANGELVACEKVLLDSYPLVQSSGDRQGVSLILSGLSIVSHLFGHYDEMQSRCFSAIEVLGDGRYHTAQYAHFLQAQADLSVLRPQEARPLYEQSRHKSMGIAAPDEWGPMFFAFLDAALFTRLQDWASAERAIQRAIPFGVPLNAPPSWSPIFLLEGCLALWERRIATNDPKVDEIASQTWRILKDFRSYAWFHPVHKGTYLLAYGEAAWLSGKPAKAMRSWQQAIEISEKLSREYDAGCGHYQIGRRSPARSESRRLHLERARSIFVKCKTMFNVDRVELLLADQNGRGG